MRLLIFLVLFGCLCCTRPPEPANRTPAPDAAYRPAYHFTPPGGWMNDPNGMVYDGGTYHLFYQHYPDSNVWGPMHWGQATSNNLINWQHQPIALYPEGGSYIFSGSAVRDSENTAGFGTGALIALYTDHNMDRQEGDAPDWETQALAFSTDGGKNWTKYAGNPVLPNPGGVADFRDPKVIRDEARGRWVMVLAVGDRIQFYGSPDLKDWTLLSEFNEELNVGVWECPDLFPMVIDGREVWVLVVSVNARAPNGGSGTFYFTGDWDGERFTRRPGRYVGQAVDSVKWLDYGPDSYAGVTWSGVPENRRIFLGWMSNWAYAQQVPTTTWRSAMTVPRELRLDDTDFGLRVRQTPVGELRKLRGAEQSVPAQRIPAGILELPVGGLDEPGVCEIDLTFDLLGSEAEAVHVTLANEAGDFMRVGYDRSRGENGFYIDRRRSGRVDFNDAFAPERRHHAPRQSNSDSLRLHLFFDRTSVELFADEGEPVMTEIFFPTRPFTRAVIEVEGDGEMVLRRGRVWGLGSSSDE